jgi:4-carboxymuconolactone decarboxylase
MPKPPTRYQTFRKRNRAVVECYERLSEVCHELGPLPMRARALVKLGMAIGSGHEGAVHAHTRLAQEAGWPPAAIRHAALLATTTLGFPAMMRAHALVEDVLESDGPASRPRPQRAAPKRAGAKRPKAARKAKRAATGKRR